MRATAYVDHASIEARCGAWLAELRPHIRPRPHLRLDPTRCALLVIDVNRAFCTPQGRAFLPAAPAVVPRIVTLIDAWHALDAPVFYTRHGHDEDGGDLNMFGVFFNDWIRADEPDADLLPTLPVHEGDLVVPKATYDAFLHTPLQQMLAQRGCSQVAITGVLTHMCCETTARSAFCRGLEVFAVADAMASSTELLHVGALRAMADAVAVVLSTDEVLQQCAM